MIRTRFNTFINVRVFRWDLEHNFKCFTFRRIGSKTISTVFFFFTLFTQRYHLVFPVLKCLIFTTPCVDTNYTASLGTSGLWPDSVSITIYGGFRRSYRLKEEIFTTLANPSNRRWPHGNIRGIVSRAQSPLLHTHPPCRISKFAPTARIDRIKKQIQNPFSILSGDSSGIGASRLLVRLRCCRIPCINGQHRDD